MNAGKISESVLKRSILRQLKSKNQDVLSGAAPGEDCAFFASLPGEIPVSCMQQNVLDPVKGELGTERTGIARIIIKCLNNLVCSGATPKAILVGLLMPEKTGEQEIRRIMQEADETAKQFGVQIAGGDTNVSAFAKAPVVSVTAYGSVAKGAELRTGHAGPGMDLILSKWVGLEGTAILARRFRETLLARYPAYLIDDAAALEQLLSVIPEAAIAMKSGVCAMHDVSRGGIFGALWEFAESAGVGLNIDMKKIPLRQETVEVCEWLNVNPYELLSGGCLLMAAPDGEKIVDALMNQGICATIIGVTTDKKERVLINEDEIRFLERPRGDKPLETEI